METNSGGGRPGGTNTPLAAKRARAEISHLNWRFPGRLHLASARPSIHPPLRQPFWCCTTEATHSFGPCRPPPPQFLPTLEREKREKHPPQAPCCASHTHPPGIASTETRRQIQKRVWHSTAANRQGGGEPISLSATCSLLGVAAATFRNPFGGFWPEPEREVCGCAVSCSTSPHTLYSSYSASPLGRCVFEGPLGAFFFSSIFFFKVFFIPSPSRLCWGGGPFCGLGENHFEAQKERGGVGVT